MPEINKVGSNIQSGGSSTSGAEQFMELLKDPHVGREELPGKLKETLLGLPEPEAKGLQNRIKNNDKDDPLTQLIRGRMNRADIQDITEFDTSLPSVKLGGNNRKNVEKGSGFPAVPLGGGKVHGKEPDIKSVPLGGGDRHKEVAKDIHLPSVPLGGGKIHGKEPDITSVPLGGGKVHGKEPDIQSVPLGGRKKWEMDNVGNQQRINLQDLLPEKPKPKK
ncbi:hypothetical protein L0152_11515 [bacterium]|nr:hypothetical protein [bacterium]